MNWSPRIEDGGLGVLHMRTQTDQEQAFVNAITPRKGFKLVVRDLSPVEFEIACVPTEDAAPENDGPAESPPISAEDMEVLAAQHGLEVKKTDRPIDIAHAVRKAQKRS